MPNYNSVKDDIIIDDDAKCKVPLYPQLDGDDKVYYIGKLQFGATWDMTVGASFMAFVSEEGFEELQITMINWDRRSSKVHEQKGHGISTDGRLKINLNTFEDSNGQTVYVGEISGPFTIPLYRGVFFTLFTSKPGREELQISELRPKKRPQRPQGNRYREEDQEEDSR